MDFSGYEIDDAVYDELFQSDGTPRAPTVLRSMTP